MIAERPTPQAVRAQRAAAGNFSFQKFYWTAKIDGQPVKVGVIYVTSGTKVYTVTPGKHRPQCNCGDFINRCAGTEKLECKHVIAARAWSQAQKQVNS